MRLGLLYISVAQSSFESQISFVTLRVQRSVCINLYNIKKKLSDPPSLLCQIYADPPFLGRQKVNDPPLNSSGPPHLLKNECSLNTCSQTSEESVQTYVTRLRKLAASCEYGALTDEFIRDRLVIGLKNQGDKVRLLREKSLTLQQAIEMCTSSETASHQMKTIEATGGKQTEDVKKLRDKKTRRYKSSKEERWIQILKEREEKRE